MNLSLVILAAGMWSRYGWLKQIDWFGPHDESLLEYSVYDALKAWFHHIVFVIRQEFSDAFHQKFSDMLDICPTYSIVYQDMPAWREKPRWTLDATLAVEDVVDGPFAVINADDRYGTQSYALIAQKLQTIREDQSFLVGYVLWNTLSNHGTVNRWVCHVDSDDMLIDVVEHYKIYKNDEGIYDDAWYRFLWSESVSMNFWWFHPSFIPRAQVLLDQFKSDHIWHETAEMVIPTAVDSLIHSWDIACEVISSPDERQWVTNPEDKPRVQEAFDEMMKNGVYPQDGLWWV